MDSSLTRTTRPNGRFRRSRVLVRNTAVRGHHLGGGRGSVEAAALLPGQVGICADVALLGVGLPLILASISRRPALVCLVSARYGPDAGRERTRLLLGRLPVAQG